MGLLCATIIAWVFAPASVDAQVAQSPTFYVDSVRLPNVTTPAWTTNVDTIRFVWGSNDQIFLQTFTVQWQGAFSSTTVDSIDVFVRDLAQRQAPYVRIASAVWATINAGVVRIDLQGYAINPRQKLEFLVTTDTATGATPGSSYTAELVEVEATDVRWNATVNTVSLPTQTWRTITIDRPQQSTD